MNEMNDAELLKRFVQDESDDAFSALVNRHIHLVYSVALRHTTNRTHAEEITQAVFIILARKAKALSRKTLLAGWLYHTARLTAANYQRMELRRMRREQEAYMESISEENPNQDADSWNGLAPLLDEAMAALKATDRDAIILRYFQRKSLVETSAALGIAERAAQKRVSRALEKLRRIFLKRGVISTTTAIAGALAAHSVQAAPAALAISITGTALKGSAVSVPILTLIKSTIEIMAWSKAKTATVASLAILLTAGTTTVFVKKSADRNQMQSGDLIERIRQVNTGLPEAQVKAKMLIFSAMSQNRIPDAANWCDTLNANRKLWPMTPTNTSFAINPQVAGRQYSKKDVASGTIPGNTVVFFETAKEGWNQAGGSELLPKEAGSVAVAFADGSASIISLDQTPNLRWKP